MICVSLIFMHQLLERLLGKRGIKDPIDLTAEERIWFDQQQKILSKDELTIGDIKEFCKTMTKVIESKWADLNLDQSKKAELIPYHSIYTTLLGAIDSPKVAREAAELNLTNILNT